MGWHEGQSGGEGKLPSMICFLLRPLSVSALQQKRERRAITGMSTHVPHKYRNTRTKMAVVILIRSSTMPNDCSHSKVPTNHWTEFHPLGTPCVCSSGTDCITALLVFHQSTASLHTLDNVLLEITNATKKNPSLCYRVYWDRGLLSGKTGDRVTVNQCLPLVL